MSNVAYTTAITFEDLKSALESIADVEEARLDIYNALDDIDDFRSGDLKVSTQLTLKFSDESEVEFYDYKATVEYDTNLQSIEDLRAGHYEYHVQGSTKELRDRIMNMVHVFLTEIANQDEE